VKHLFIPIAAVLLTACSIREPKSITREPHVVLNVWKHRPVGIHEEINPSWEAAMDNGDTIYVSGVVKPGDTIYYEIRQY